MLELEETVLTENGGKETSHPWSSLTASTSPRGPIHILKKLILITSVQGETIF